MWDFHWWNWSWGWAPVTAGVLFVIWLPLELRRRRRYAAYIKRAEEQADWSWTDGTPDLNSLTTDDDHRYDLVGHDRAVAGPLHLRRKGVRGMGGEHRGAETSRPMDRQGAAAGVEIQ